MPIRRSCVAFTALAGALLLAAPASARQDPWLDLQLSYTPEENGFWSDMLVYGPPGTTVYARVVMHIPEEYYGVAGARFNITSDTLQWQQGLDICDLTTAKGSATDGRMPGFDFGSSPQQVFGTNSALRIDMKDDVNDVPSVGINASQASPVFLGTNFNTGKSVTVYKFALTLFTIANASALKLKIADGANHGSPDQLTAFRAYESAASSASVEVPNAYGDDALIVLPSPAALLLLATPVTIRRRRSR